ncbi:MAG: hypothetical protein ACYTG0_40130 [Planctomycetota bacterium]|jgi:hypothetical protein
MSKRTRGKIARVGGYFELFLFAGPLLGLLGTALLHWTMQVLLEPRLLMRFLKLVGLPFYIVCILAAPPLLLAWGAAFLCRRSENVFAIVFLMSLLFWGFFYLIPPIVENWDTFLELVEDFGAV